MAVVVNGTAEACLPSHGSAGHPLSCAPACHWWQRPQGCVRGSECIRCHICERPKIGPRKGQRKVIAFELAASQGLDTLLDDIEPDMCTTQGRSALLKLHDHLIAKNTKETWRRASPSVDVGKAAVVALTQGSKACILGLATAQTHVEVLGSVVPTQLDAVVGKLEPSWDLRQDFDIMTQIREHLINHGFAVMPHSGELIDIVRAMEREDVDVLRRCRLSPSIGSSRIAESCIAQLKLILPASFIILGMYKTRFRENPEDHATSMHKDDVHLTRDDLHRALFPFQSALQDFTDPFDRFVSFCADAHAIYPSLIPPDLGEGLHKVSSNGDFDGPIQTLLDGIAHYNDLQANEEDELVFSNINVWVPRASKRLVFLPLEVSAQITYPLGIDDVQAIKAQYANYLQAFHNEVALAFFGQSVMHQALMGPDFDCEGGSLEGRYLTLTSRRCAHNGSLRNSVSEWLTQHGIAQQFDSQDGTCH